MAAGIGLILSSITFLSPYDGSLTDNIGCISPGKLGSQELLPCILSFPHLEKSVEAKSPTTSLIFTCTSYLIIFSTCSNSVQF
jgi:hypothetical protein